MLCCSKCCQCRKVRNSITVFCILNCGNGFRPFILLRVGVVQLSHIQTIIRNHNLLYLKKSNCANLTILNSVITCDLLCDFCERIKATSSWRPWVWASSLQGETMSIWQRPFTSSYQLQGCSCITHPVLWPLWTEVQVKRKSPYRDRLNITLFSVSI